MKKVNLPYLPDGFSAEEEEDYLYLLYNKERIATFSSGGSGPEIVVATAEAHLCSLKKN